jgi:hypothetical protein
MAKNIQLNLVINGVKQNVNNIKELEEAIKKAEETLKGLDIGSEQFKSLSTQVKQAKGVFEDFQESIKGQELEKRVGAFAKVGEGITASFAGAQAAIALFGNESEDVAAAAAKAQGLLTIALAARSAAEGVVAVRTVAANIATYASAAAAGAATTATRVLYATLAANPYGAILAVIGLVVGALVAFTGESKKSVNVSKEITQATSAEADALKQQLFILTQLTGARNLQKKTLDDLRKQYPGFNAFIDKENKLNEQGVRFLKLKIKQYELEAQAKLIVQKIAENNIKILEIESESLVDNVSFWEKSWNLIKTGGSIAGATTANYITGLQNQRKKIGEVTAESDKWRGALTKTYLETDKVLGALENYNVILDKTVKLEENAEQASKNAEQQKKAVDQSYKDGLKALTNYTEALAMYTKQTKELDELLNRISKQKYEAQILDSLKTIQDLRKGNIEALNKAGDTYLKTIEKISKVPTDVFIQSYGKFRVLLEEQLSAGTGAFRDQIKLAFGDNELTQQQKVIVDNLAESYGKLFEFIKNTPGLQNFVNGLKDVNVAFDDIRENSDGVTPTLRSGFDALQYLFGDLLAIYGDYKKEVDENGTISEVLFDPAETKKSADAFLATLKNSLLRPTQIAFDTTQRDVLKKQLALQEGFKKSAVAGSDEFNKAEIEIAKLKGQIDQLEARLKVLNSNKPFTEFSNDVTKGVDESIANFIKLGNGIVKVEQDIIGINEEVKKLSTTLTGVQLGEAIGGVILQNIDIISNTIIGARTKTQKAEKEFIDKVKLDEEGLAKFRKDLSDQGIDLDNTTNDQLLQSFIAFKKKEKEVNDQAEKDKQDKYKETLAALSQGFELFSTTLNQISSLQRERVQTDLEGLKIAEKNTLEQVVGDSEQAAAKRLEIQAEYEAKAKEIEKKGRIDSLKFSLAQAIASGAQAFVRSLAELGPILGPIMAGVNAALTLAQVAIIQDQISNAQMMRKGGLLKAQGGMLLSGPSHENGGIPLAQMGVVAEGQETIINRQSSINFRDLLSTINQSGGGRPLVVNNFDDSRIVEAIASQKQKPLRAYVLQSEITREQAISQRLDDLSKI